MHIIEPNIEDIIIRELKHQASAEELSMLKDWIDRDAGNKKEYETLHRIWEESASIATPHHFDTAGAWEKVEQKLGIRANRGRGKVVQLFSWQKMVAAASVMIVAAAGLLFFLKSQSASELKIITATESNKRLLLPDGSVVTLRKGSKFYYPENFSKKERSTNLEGEAYFEVRPDPSKPFRISTAKGLVEVLGTSFLIRIDDSVEQVLVSSGRVKFYDRYNASQQVILTAGDKGQLKHGKLSEEVIKSSIYLAWQKGVLIFNNTTLDQIVEDLNHFYNGSVTLSERLKEASGSITVTAQFENQSLYSVLEEIQLTTGLLIKREKERIVLDLNTGR